MSVRVDNFVYTISVVMVDFISLSGALCPDLSEIWHRGMLTSRPSGGLSCWARVDLFARNKISEISQNSSMHFIAVRRLHEYLVHLEVFVLTA